MSWVTVIWSMVASTCLTLSAIYFVVWWTNRTAWAHLFFAVNAAATTGVAFCELAVMWAQTPAEIADALRWLQLALFFVFVSITWFVGFYLRAGRLWLAWTITGWRTFYLMLTFLAGINVNYRTVSLRQIRFLGESVTIPGGVPNPLTLFGQLGVLLMLVFVADASITTWRRGERRKARMVGGSVVFFITAGLATVSILLWANVEAPIVISHCYLGLVVVMGYELSRDVLRASQLVRELQANEAELRESEARTQLLRQEVAHAGRVSMMGQLASALAHEINQPLGAILRNAEAAELFLQHPSPDMDEIRAILADIRRDDERAGAVIDRMRGLLRRHTLETRWLDVGTLVDEVAALVRVDAVTRQVTLDMMVPDDLPQVRGDRVHLQQVLLNLIINGMDALNGAHDERRRLSLTVRLEGLQVIQIAVGDRGSGIPPDTLPRIFDPFFTTKPDGMGMGLAISRTIVEAHGGRIWAENQPGGGATFCFTLPIASVDTPA